MTDRKSMVGMGGESKLPLADYQPLSERLASDIRNLRRMANNWETYAPQERMAINEHIRRIRTLADELEDAIYS